MIELVKNSTRIYFKKENDEGLTIEELKKIDTSFSGSKVSSNLIRKNVIKEKALQDGVDSNDREC